MKSVKKKLVLVLGWLLILGMVLAACGGQEVAESLPTATNTATIPPAPTDTAVPTRTPTATQTATPKPTATLQPTDTPTHTPTAVPTHTPVAETSSDFPLPMPVGVPVAEWNNIPIMPEATAGEGDDKGYAFVVEATAVKVQAFYEQEMGKLGWTLLGVGEGETGTYLMIFQKEAEVASISIIAVDPNTMYVLMVK